MSGAASAGAEAAVEGGAAGAGGGRALGEAVLDDATVLASAEGVSDASSAPRAEEEAEGGASASGGLQDVQQLLYRRRGLRSLTLPGSVDFRELISLRVLSLSHNELVDLGPIAELPALQELNVNNNKVRDLTPAFRCEALEVLLAAGNRITSIEGLALPRLRRLSLFGNLLSDHGEVLRAVVALPRLEALDLAGNGCGEGAAQRYAVIREAPTLVEFDGEPVRAVDRQLAREFFSCALELGFEEHTTEAQRLASRPKTAPAFGAGASPVGFSPPSRGVGDGAALGSPPSGGSSRVPSASPDREPTGLVDEEALLAEELTDPESAARRRSKHVEALHIRLRTMQVECENLRRQISEIKAAEPELGAARLRDRLAELQAEVGRMHELGDENIRVRQRLAGREAELEAKRRELGLPEDRPGSSAGRPHSSAGSGGSRPRTAASAAEAVLGLSACLAASFGGGGSAGRLARPPSGGPGASVVPALLMPARTGAEIRARNGALRREIDRANEEIARLRSDACSAFAGRELSPPARPLSGRGLAERLAAAEAR